MGDRRSQQARSLRDRRKRCIVAEYFTIFSAKALCLDLLQRADENPCPRPWKVRLRLRPQYVENVRQDVGIKRKFRKAGGINCLKGTLGVEPLLF